VEQRIAGPGFADQVAVVTGASSGIGKAIARGLAAGGMTVCLVGRDRGRLEAAARDAGSRVHCYMADLARDEDLRGLGERLQRDCPSIDVLVHSAGVISLGRLEEAPIEELDRQYRVNVRAPFALTQSLLPLIRARRGQIVLINSTAGIHARGSVAQYAATKHALKGIADSLREEVNADGVRVLSIFLGRTASPMQAALHLLEGNVYRPEQLVQPEDVAAMVLSALGLPRSAEVTEISIRPMRKPEGVGT
jgi:NADP-dependent 3-hydroxy acid dehydrogenase YdfG